MLTLGTEGVSMFGFKSAKLRGACVIAGSSVAPKRQRLMELGADVVFDYTAREDWDEVARAATGGRRVDFVIDVRGNA